MPHEKETPAGDSREERQWIVVSNRLPVQLRADDSGRITFERSSGGLATALSGVSRDREFTWIGWPGGVVEPDQQEDVRRQMSAENLGPVFLDREEVDRYYHGFCNAVIWPAFHYFTTLTDFERAAWEMYQRVNQRFAEEVAEKAAPGALVWLHDFHLMLVPGALRRLRPDLGIGFFLHIPFPSSEIYRLLPCREQLLKGVLGADYVSFHTQDYARYFRAACLRVLGADSEPTHIDYAGHRVAIGVDPIGVDTEAFAEDCRSDAGLEAYSHLCSRYAGRKLLLGVERLDYTKGVLERMRAFEHFLETRGERSEPVTLLQIIVPSRLGHADYQELKREIEEEVGRINGRFGHPGYTPIEYIHRSIPRHELVAMYRLADVGLVTPLRDGMNLVAQEYVLCQGVDSEALPPGHGILVLSEFAGAAQSLSRSILVNPMDCERLGLLIDEALEMRGEEKLARMRAMLPRVLDLDCRRWADRFFRRMEAAIEFNEASRSDRSSRTALLRSMVQSIKNAPTRLLFLDYDGTLREIEKHPEDATPTEEVRRLLAALAATPGNQVHLVSGRRRAEFERWFAGLPIWICAEHGAAFRDPDERWERLEGLDLGWMQHVRDVFAAVCRDVPETFIEEKPASLAWHYRLADPEYTRWRAHELIAQLQGVLAQQSAEVLAGHRVIEVRPMGVNKGEYVSDRVRNANSSTVFVAIGDDRTDLDMYRALPREAVTVHVGSRPDEARFTLESPRQVREFLRLLAGEEDSMTAGAST